MNYEGRIDLFGKLVDDVGKHYRNISPYTICPLCRQLHASWIVPFLRKQDSMQRKANDFGDQIHIFRHLRHLPHVNDFQTAKNVLRTYNTPYHIAVVPLGRGWLDELLKHIEVNGMVVVVLTGHPESEIFVPQQVSTKFDPNVVISWLKFCKHHKSLCNPKAPEVKGMKVIDCGSKDLIIRDSRPNDKYVALSYVWGNLAPSETPTMTLIGKETPEREDTTKTKPKGLQAVARTPLHIHKPKLDPTQKMFVRKQTLAVAVKTTHCAAAALQEKPVLRLPKDIPLTIKDAIRVTKDLGFRFLWVDKYCIDQSNETEKEQQCSRMGDIYAGSQITIFALGPNSSYGLPGVSSRLRSEQRECTTIRQYKFVSTMPDPHFSIKQSKWATRAWTYQEGLFSTRRLFFTDFQVYFECNAMNCAETFKSNLKILHIQSGQRFRSYHCAGKFVCGNPNQYSHLDVKRNPANHRKVDTIRRCQYQIRQYTKTELTNKNDVLNAFAGIARFYAKSTAKIASLAGIPIPFPIAKLSDIEREGLDHLSYALAWTHCIHNNPKPQRRKGFPSWSWAGWFGKIGKRDDLPYCWTSHLSSVRIGYRGGDIDVYASLQRFAPYKQYLIRRLLTAKVLHFDAYVLDPRKLKFWEKRPHMPSRQVPSRAIHVYLSIGTCSLEQLHRRLIDGEFKCLVLGTHGEPRKNIFKAIQTADRRSPNSRNRRIDLFERREPDAIICLIVYTVHRISYRIGLLKVGSEGLVQEYTIQVSDLGLKESFVLK
jgi:Heterokaryon incompatibility protein (HET)